MSDDLVKQSIAELQDLVRCRCHEAYKGRGLRDPDCHCDTAETVKTVAARIEELEAKLASCEKYRDAYNEMGRIGTEAYRDLDAKLARALEALEQIEDTRDTLGMIQRLRRQQSDMHTTLAELKNPEDSMKGEK